MKTKLKNGLIPAGTECPFKDECSYSFCNHNGVWHSVNFSCAFARGFDLIQRYDVNDGLSSNPKKNEF